MVLDINRRDVKTYRELCLTHGWSSERHSVPSHSSRVERQSKALHSVMLPLEVNEVTDSSEHTRKISVWNKSKLAKASRLDSVAFEILDFNFNKPYLKKKIRKRCFHLQLFMFRRNYFGQIETKFSMITKIILLAIFSIWSIFEHFLRFELRQVHRTYGTKEIMNNMRL